MNKNPRSTNSREVGSTSMKYWGNFSTQHHVEKDSALPCPIETCVTPTVTHQRWLFTSPQVWNYSKAQLAECWNWACNVSTLNTTQACHVSSSLQSSNHCFNSKRPWYEWSPLVGSTATLMVSMLSINHMASYILTSDTQILSHSVLDYRHVSQLGRCKKVERNLSNPDDTTKRGPDNWVLWWGCIIWCFTVLVTVHCADQKLTISATRF